MISHDLKNRFIKTLEAAKTSCPVVEHSSTGLLRYLNRLSIIEAQYALLNFGEKLKLFTDLIDIHHPDLANLYEGHLIGEAEGSFSKESTDLIRICLFIKQFGLSKNALCSLRNSILYHSKYAFLSKVIDSPIANQLHVRFVKSPQIREKIRLTKKCQDIFMPKEYHDQWEALPNNLDAFSRHSNVFSSEIEQIQERKKVFLNHGLTSLASELDKSIEDISVQSSKQTYLGFNKIKIPFVALVLAKMHGFVKRSDSLYDRAFYDIEKSKFEFDFSIQSSSSIRLYSKVFMQHEFSDIDNEEIKSLVSYLESLPELGNRPAFDYYRVVVPSFFPIFSDSKPFQFRNKFNEIVSFDDSNEAYLALSKELLAENLFGALIGERDGEHYFISYFV